MSGAEITKKFKSKSKNKFLITLSKDPYIFNNNSDKKVKLSYF
ncbi:hypothetical protein HMPREF9129_0438 [Peptoniphilus indolicus ATCC 29427]|uniref:Uncharacterized protein n=1 Tax=Peptoniphilus indolicus ATCC 29427 TaxID=997350 RepID=G4D208_9FIRM|nr:hypothetical protein HMPREF9129_0438 [Peptoniphilus indolicus ATCC 29427]